MNQNEVFSAGEGDAWFKRNEYLQTLEQAMLSEDFSFICDFFRPFKKNIHRVLEIGCSSGAKLECICHELGASGVGIEPSVVAVEVGNKRKKIADVSLFVGTGDRLAFEENKFDLVYFSFCLYLFDRRTLMQAISEADRVLRPGGFLVITDFDPGNIYKRPYSHTQGVFSYKQDYSDFYLKSSLYYLAGKHCFSHENRFFDELHNERISTSILYKEIDPYLTQP